MRLFDLLRKRRPLNVLITNIWLTEAGGTETYVRELAFELQKRGHLPMAYSPKINENTKKIFGDVPLVDDLKLLPFKPDIIHGHHREPTISASEYFSDVPVIFVSHSAADFLFTYEMPEVSSRISRYIAVDLLVREALLASGVPAEKIQVIYNFVDTKRFR